MSPKNLEVMVNKKLIGILTLLTAAGLTAGDYSSKDGYLDQAWKYVCSYWNQPIQDKQPIQAQSSCAPAYTSIQMVGTGLYAPLGVIYIGIKTQDGSIDWKKTITSNRTKPHAGTALAIQKAAFSPELMIGDTPRRHKTDLENRVQAKLISKEELAGIQIFVSGPQTHEIMQFTFDNPLAESKMAQNMINSALRLREDLAVIAEVKQAAAKFIENARKCRAQQLQSALINGALSQDMHETEQEINQKINALKTKIRGLIEEEEIVRRRR